MSEKATISSKDVGKMTDSELNDEAADLAKLRTAVRLRQNEVADELTLRQAVAANPALGRVISLRLEGGIAPAGEKG